MDKISGKLKEIRQKAIDKKNEHKKRMEALRAAKKAKMAAPTKMAAEDENKEPIHMAKTKMQTRNKKNTELNKVPISTKPKEEEATITKKEGKRKENQMMRICILTVSDSSSKKPELDKSGPLLAKILQKSKNLEIEILDQSILADEKDLIMEYLCTYSTNADCILTTGGTGMGKRDVTPEATKEVIERECPGIVTALLMRGLQATPFAALTRLAAGIRNNCLIVNLPGSPKAVSEGLEVLEPILPHAIALLEDKQEEIGRDHKAINSQAD